MAQHNSFDPFHISLLVIKMINGEITDKEQNELNNWLSANPQNNLLLKKLLNKEAWGKDIADMNAFDSELALAQVLQKINPPKEKYFKLKSWQFISKITAAAVVLIAIGAIFYFANTSDKIIAGKTNLVKKSNEKPQDDKIILTLSDGNEVDLESVSAKSTIKQGGTTLSRKNGQLNYKQSEDIAFKSSQTIVYNTIKVPAGKQYQVVLPDGTGVWLNAQTSLKYPVAFLGTDRVVELTGEAYFEVKHQASKPFRVLSNGQTVEVLGTRFNVESYLEDKKTITTLAEGSVRIDNGKSTIKLKPGQKTINDGDNQLKVLPANIAEALAWKNGLLSFSDERIEDIMRKVARSYNVEIEFQGNVKDKRFWGAYPREKGLSNLLKNLEQTQTIHFKINGRRIIVMP